MSILSIFCFILAGMSLGMALLLFFTEDDKCTHDWDLVDNITSKHNGNVTGMADIYRCKICKTYKKEVIVDMYGVFRDFK